MKFKCRTDSCRTAVEYPFVHIYGGVHDRIVIKVQEAIDDSLTFLNFDPGDEDFTINGFIYGEISDQICEGRDWR